MDLSSELQNYLQQAKKEPEVISFAEYLEKVRKCPTISSPAHKRIYDMIRSYGVIVDEEGRETYKYFERELFGIENATREIMEYFKGAAQGSDVGRRFLMLYGPPSSGKSNLLSMVKRDLEAWTKTDQGAVYCIDGCPMNSEPLMLIPKELRVKFEDELKVKIDGELNPIIALKLKELGGDFMQMKCRRIYFSEQDRRGIGTFVPSDPKCVVGSTLLLTNQGLLSFDEIQEKLNVEENQEKPFDTEISGINGVERTSKFYSNGVKQTYRLTTQFGYEIIGSENHPVLTIKNGKFEFVKLKESFIGRHIVLQRGQNIFGSIVALPKFEYDGSKPRMGNLGLTLPTEMSLELASFLGYLVSEGSITDTGIWFSNADGNLISKFCILSKELFNVEPKSYPKFGTPCMNVSISCIKLARWLEQVCGLERGSENKSIPMVIRTAPERFFWSFFNALSWGDGTISARQGLMTNRYKYSTASNFLAKQLQIMLLNTGIVSSLVPEPREVDGGTQIYHSVVVTGDNVLSILEKTDLSSKNTNENGKFAQETGCSNFDLIHIHGFVAEIIARAKNGHSSPLSKWRKYSYESLSNSSRSFSRSSFNAFLKDADPYLTEDEKNSMVEIGRSDLLFLSICNVKKEGEESVYDITVPKSHTFCANGIISHNSQDIAELIGSVDLSKIGVYGTESDPRAYRFDGELNVSNRGMMEFIEILKADPRFLYVLLTATQEKNIKTPRFPLISCDIAIISHTNESEFKEFCGNPKNEALIDRMIVCRVPYNLRVNEEVKIYEKLMRHGAEGVHVAPHTLQVAAMFSVLSRLADAKDANLDKVKKMKLYNNEDVEGFSEKDIPRIQRESIVEGMDGVSPRYVINRLITTAIRGQEEGITQFITPIDVLRSLKDGLNTSSKFKPEERSRYEELLGLVKTEFDQIARTEVQKAFFVSFNVEAKTLMDNYVDHVEAYLDKTKITDPVTQEELDPDEKLMRAIETKIGITDSQKDSFRNEVMRKVAAAERRGVKFNYQDHSRLREAIEKQLFEERRDTIKITITSRTNQDPEQLKRINQVVDTLVKNHGYIAESANELLKYVSSMMAREK